MVIGRRRDISVENRTLYLPDSVDYVATVEGELHHSHGVDYFAIAGNLYPWHIVPDFVIGRPAYDNYLVSIASSYNMSIVDASNSVTALHQTDEEGVGSGHRCRDSNYNRQVITRDHMRLRGCSRSDCTEYLTKLAGQSDSSATIFLSNLRKGRPVLVVKRSTR